MCVSVCIFIGGKLNKRNLRQDLSSTCDTTTKFEGRLFRWPLCLSCSSYYPPVITPFTSQDPPRAPVPLLWVLLKTILHCGFDFVLPASRPSIRSSSLSRLLETLVTIGTNINPSFPNDHCAGGWGPGQIEEIKDNKEISHVPYKY